MADVSLIIGTTLADYAAEIADNISDRNAFMAYMKIRDGIANGRQRKRMVVVQGGERFKETLYSAVNPTFRAYEERETIDTTAHNPIKEAEYAIKSVAGSVNISKLEEAQNVGKYQIHNLVDTLKESAEMSMAEVMGAAALSDGTTDPKLPGGLRYLASLTDSASVAVGSIDPIANTWWRPYRDTSGVTAWNTSDEGLIALTSLMNNSTRGAYRPDCIVTTVTTKSLIDVMALKLLQLNSPASGEMAKLGFRTVNFNGAEVMADDNVPTGYLYAINTEFTRFQVLAKGNFAMTKMKEPLGGLYSVMQLYVFCNFTCGARRLNALMTSITA